MNWNNKTDISVLFAKLAARRVNAPQTWPTQTGETYGKLYTKHNDERNEDAATPRLRHSRIPPLHVSFYLPFTAHHQFRILNFVFGFFWRILPLLSHFLWEFINKKNCFKNLHPLESGGGKKISKPPPNPSFLFLIEASKSRNQNESWIWQRCACVTTFPFAEACFEQTRRFRINWEFHVVDEPVYKFISTYILHIKWHFIHVKTVWQVNRIICQKCIFRETIRKDFQDPLY